MVTSPPPRPGTARPGRLVAQIESLNDGFRRLSKPATLGDLSAQYVKVVGNVFPDATIDLYLTSGRSTGWQSLSGAGAGGADQLPAFPSDDTGPLFTSSRRPPRISIVQRLTDKSYAGVVVRLRRKGKSFTDGDRVSIQLSLQLFDNAYQCLLHRKKEKDLQFSLNHRLLQLNSLIDTGIEVSKLGQETSLQHLALERAASLTNASKGRLTVKREGRVKEQFNFPVGVKASRSGERSLRLASSFKFGGNTYRFELFEKESREGAIPFEDTDQLLLDALVRQVHASMENRHLLQQILEKHKIEQELAVAASIQQKILPKTLPAIEGYDIAGINIPSKSVGGDYYDCLPLPDGRFALIIADVAGKGVPAALLVSSFHAFVSAYLETSMPVIELVKRLNRAVCGAATQDRFITAFIALLNPKTGALETVNAGHTSGYLLRNDSTLLQLNSGGIPLGMLDVDFPYESDQVTIGSGERLLLYTDGITEAANPREQFFDNSVPLSEIMKARKPERAGEFIAGLISEIRNFTQGAPQNDDITAMYLLRK